ncbi:MAG: 50S ribosome-binding GTPase, partial [Candidatus Midichloria mitochondrii]|nr:50S ribosome-binding GTPase [Candidatus Midichloria mitochondrii]
MLFNQATFLTSATNSRNLPKTQLPEIAFIGRSNVGKSSLINAIIGNAKMAKTSKTPGRTQQINFFKLPELI